MKKREAKAKKHKAAENAEIRGLERCWRMPAARQRGPACRGGLYSFFSCVSGLIKPYMPEAWRILELSAGLEGWLPRAAALVFFSGLCVIAQETAFRRYARKCFCFAVRRRGAFSLLLGLAAQASPFLAAGAAAADCAPCCVFVRFTEKKRGIRAHYGKERVEEAKGRACAGGHKTVKNKQKRRIFCLKTRDFA